MSKSKGIIFFVSFLCMWLIMYGVALMSKTVTIPTVGTVKTIGVEADVDFIDWEMVEPNSSNTQLINVQPTGNVPVTLTLATANWTPPNASQFLTLTWNYTGQILQPFEWTPVELTLTVASNVTGIDSFSFDILIIAEET